MDAASSVSMTSCGTPDLTRRVMQLVVLGPLCCSLSLKKKLVDWSPTSNFLAKVSVTHHAWTSLGPPALAATPSGGSRTAPLGLDNTLSCVRGPGPRRAGVAAPPALVATPLGGSRTAPPGPDNTPLCVRWPGPRLEGVFAPPAATLSGGNGTTPPGLVIRGLVGAC